MTIIGENYIRFDWAMKRLLRNKANYVVLEGFLSSLIGRKFKIQRFLESEGNQEDEFDKYNRVDILAEGEDGELCIIEVQNNREITYFHRMLYGVSKAITEYIGTGQPYDKVRKVYSINIVYFELGQGKDYVYHGQTVFRGIHEPHDTLKLSVKQNERFFGNSEKDILKRKEAGALFPEYYVLRVNDFDSVAKTPLDEWMKFLKTGEISDDAKAAGLPEARECLRVDALSDADKRTYFRHMEAIHHMRSLFDTSHYEGYYDGRADGLAEGLADGLAEGMEKGLAKGREEGLAKGREEGMTEGYTKRSYEIARQMKKMNIANEQITQATGLTVDEIVKL